MRYTVVLIITIVLLISGCQQKKKYHDTVQKKPVLNSSESYASILKFQNSLNEEFKNPETSPLPDRFRKDFETLAFFSPDTNYVINAHLVRTPNAVPFLMRTTTNRTSEEVVYGVAHFKVNGSPYELEIYQTKEPNPEEKREDYLFLPFTDLTNGEETYGGGRYLDLSVPSGDSILIDFNKAYNPYCVYNKKYSCPLVSSANHLNIRVTAGVKDFKKAKN